MMDQLTDTISIRLRMGSLGAIAPIVPSRRAMWSASFGSRIPAILRPHDDNKYRLVSFAYIDGLVNGDFVSNEAKGRRDTERFEII